VSEDRRLVVAGVVGVVSVIGYATLAASLGQQWYGLMAVLLIPHCVSVALFIHFKLLY